MLGPAVQIFSVQSQGGGKSKRGSHNRNRQVRLLYVVKVEAPQQGQCLNRLEVCGSYALKSQILHGSVVVDSVTSIVGCRRRHAAHCEYNVEQGKPAAVLAPARQVCLAEGFLFDEGYECVDVNKVGVYYRDLVPCYSSTIISDTDPTYVDTHGQ
jgi:hypothetical protein